MLQLPITGRMDEVDVKIAHFPHILVRRTARVLAALARALARRLAPTPPRAMPGHVEGFALSGLATALCINAA